MQKLSRSLLAANIVALIAVAIWFRCRDLGNLPGINGDEAWYGVQAELVLHGEPIEWRTPTGNLLNPFFFGPQLLAHAIWAPSIGVLRATAVLSGLLALAVNYRLCRSVFGRRAAVISTTILAVLPINIIYSRLAWDASQSLLATLLAIYWPLGAIVNPKRRTILTCSGLVALAAAIIVHPTNLFVVPVVLAALLVAWRAELKVIWQTSLGLAFAFCLTTTIFWIVGSHEQARLASIADRATDPDGYAQFFANLERLYSGVTSYQYVAGSLSTDWGSNWLSGAARYDVAIRVIACLTGFGVLKRLVTPPAEPIEDGANPTRPDTASDGAIAALLVGWLVSLIAFYLIAGPGAIAPHFERYGIFLVAPAAILAAIAIQWWTECGRCAGLIAAAISLACGWTILAGFNANFFECIEKTGGKSHSTFRTAAVEPKQLAINYVRGRSDSPIEIRAAEWWNYWPLRYLSFAGGSTRLTPISVVNSGPMLERAGGDHHKVWQVEFTDSPACLAARRLLREAGIPANEATINDFADRPILSLFDMSSYVAPNKAKTLNHKQREGHEEYKAIQTGGKGGNGQRSE